MSDVIMDTPGNLMDRLSIVNIKLWMQEDKVRDSNYDPVITAECKRKIDELNLQRNTIIEKIDEVLKAGNYKAFHQLKDYGRKG